MIGQRLSKVGTTLAEATAPYDPQTAQARSPMTADGAVAVGPGLTRITQDEVDAIFG